MKKILLLVAVLATLLESCKNIRVWIFGPKIIKEEVTFDNCVMRCLVKDLLVRRNPWVEKGDKGLADLDKGCMVEYLGEKSNEEVRSYKQTFKSKPERKDFWYKVRFQVRNGRFKGETWIGWVHGGGMEVVKQQAAPVVTTPSDINASNGIRKWAVIVGVSDYPDNRMDLNYCDDDAKAYYQFLRSSEGGSVPENHIALLTDQMATTKNILDYCNSIFAQAQKDDIIIFYFSGHGSPEYFCAYDGSLWHNDIKGVLQNSPAKRKMMIGDACFAGSMIAPPAPTESDYTDYYNDKDGIAFISASKRDETSAETSQLQHGIFTYYFLNGLRSCNANEDNNAYIDITELRDYIKTQFQNKEGQIPQFGGTFDAAMPVSSCE
jgi:Caspase domain